MAPYVEEVWKLQRRFDNFWAVYVPRGENTAADELSQVASKQEQVPPGIYIEVLRRPSVPPEKLMARSAPGAGDPSTSTTRVASLEAQDPAAPPAGEAMLSFRRMVLPVEGTYPPWARDIVKYIMEHALLEDNHDAERVARQAKLYVMIDGELYRRRDNGVKLRCIPQEQGQVLLRDIHEGTCSSHVASRSLAGKVFRHGFYWPTVLSDAEQLVKTCEACQYYAKNIHQPAQALQPILISWPFAVWGLDIVGKIPKSVGGHEYLFVAIDKFTKWVEVMPVPRQTAQAAIKFVEGIVYHFGVPNRIITDNGSQFTSRSFLNFCEELGIKVCFASVSYPRCNGQVERANAEVLKGLKTKAFDKLEDKGKNWIEHLPIVLWK